ncbi:hypothetical protein JOF29_005993 [Kribbella aluminosa]|uniref:Uncharacterized protein n=1 Tax=Kribbella aluminosa TaxID=416017 RepID=A0ABS4UTB6_9ACTN|nr:hypothetical protein [Kribbella aluminosa]MBP2354883.1 hypothetical protein [Kribbella aluminosa]
MWDDKPSTPAAHWAWPDLKSLAAITDLYAIDALGEPGMSVQTRPMRSTASTRAGSRPTYRAFLAARP